ncbi:MAG: glycosyltransferase family 39 protein [Rhodospirillales bacterium]|nr:glycosyltransferase family 39 protein [Rhodospirillales bacterium]
MANSPGKATRPEWATLAAVIVFGLGLRLAATGGDLWIDEVWTLFNLDIARTLTSAADWTPLFFHTNTHALNSLYLATLGPDASVFAMRLPSVIFGTAMVLMAAAISWRKSPREGLIAALMIVVSYPMVTYGAEARGYALMMLAALAAYYLLETWLEDPRPKRAMGFVIVCLLGFAAHQSFVVVLAGLGLWAMAALFRTQASFIDVVAQLTKLFGVQAIAVVSFGAVAWGNIVFGGQEILPLIQSIAVMGEVTFGIDPMTGIFFSPIIAAILGLVLAYAIWLTRKRSELSWIFFGFVVIAYPLGILLFAPDLHTLPRYFIPSALFALMAVAAALSQMLGQSPWRRRGAAFIILLFCLSNGFLLGKLFTTGRGAPAEAVAMIAEDTNKNTGPARVAGYHPFSVKMMVEHFARAQGLEKSLTFVSPDEDAKNPAEWFIDGGFFAATNKNTKAPPGWFVKNHFSLTGGKEKAGYELRASFPHWGLSGDSWYVYRLKKPGGK